MDRQAEHEDKESRSLGKGEEVDTTPSNGQLMRMLVLLKLKLIAGYILDGFAPFVAATALIVAVFVYNENHASVARLVTANEVINTLNASLSASKAEVEKLKAVMAQEKVMQEEARKIQDERTTKIIQNVSKLQSKLKVSPTLEDQLHQAAIISIVPPVVAVPVVPVKAGASVEKNSKPVTASVSASAEKNSAGQMHTLKEAIKKFNQ